MPVHYNYVGVTYGAGSVALPSGWKELLTHIAYNDNYITSTFLSDMFVQNRGVSLGNYGSSYALGEVSKTSATLTQVMWGGSDVTTSVGMYVYVR